MKGADKDAAMARFAAGESRLLVATTVIEVGVDVPEASIMVIEHAERFGLAQLHQLRGRIGRGAERSTCLLLYKAPLGETAKARLAVCARPTTASALPRKICACAAKAMCSARARAACRAFASRVSRCTATCCRRRATMPRSSLRAIRQLASPRGDALRMLLYLFERDEARPADPAG